MGPMRRLRRPIVLEIFFILRKSMVTGEREGIIRPVQAESGADNHACGSEHGVQYMMLAEGPAGGQAGHRRPLPLPHRRGQLQLALPVPLRLPGCRGEDCHLQEGVHVLLGRDRIQDPRTAHPADLGRRPLLCRRLPGCGAGTRAVRGPLVGRGAELGKPTVLEGRSGGRGWGGGEKGERCCGWKQSPPWVWSRV